MAALMPEFDLLRALAQDKAQYPEAQRRQEIRRWSPSPSNLAKCISTARANMATAAIVTTAAGVPVARDIVAAFRPEARHACARRRLCQGISGQGSDDGLPGARSFRPRYLTYALIHCEPATVGRLHLGTVEHLPFPDDSFDAVLSINTVHNLGRQGCIASIAGNCPRRARPGELFRAGGRVSI